MVIWKKYVKCRRMSSQFYKVFILEARVLKCDIQNPLVPMKCHAHSNGNGTFYYTRYLEQKGKLDSSENM